MMSLVGCLSLCVPSPFGGTWDGLGMHVAGGEEVGGIMMVVVVVVCGVAGVTEACDVDEPRSVSIIM